MSDVPIHRRFVALRWVTRLGLAGDRVQQAL